MITTECLEELERRLDEALENDDFSWLKNKPMKNKIKYESKFDLLDIDDSFFSELSELDCLKQLEVADNPTIYKTVPNGTYFVRGNTKGNTKVYAVYDNVWYWSKLNKDRLRVISRFELYPNLKTSEWKELHKHFSKLNKKWRRFVSAWLYNEECRNSEREFAKLFLSHDKKDLTRVDYISNKA